MYVEAQVGSQCRRHALNAYMGGPVVQWGDIEGFARDFEAYYGLPDTDGMSRDFDFFNADGSSLLTWAAGRLAPERFFVVLPFGRVQEWLDDFGASSVDDLVGDDPRAMVFRQDHVYAARRKDGDWYALDSLSPHPFRMNVNRPGRETGMVVGLVPEAAAKVAWSLEAKIFKFLNRFPGTHTQTARELLAKDALGDLGGNVENWVKTRLRALGWLRGSQSRSYRLHTHVAKVMRDYKGVDDAGNQALLAYATVCS